MLQGILGMLTIITAGFTTVYVKDFKKNRDTQVKGVFGHGLVIGFITDFLDAIGVGSFATTTAILKFNKKVSMVKGSSKSFKITTKEDIELFKALLEVELNNLI